MESFLLNNLYLVDKPQSNRYAVQMSQNAEIARTYSASKLYFIAQREEIFFKNVKVNGVGVNSEKSPFSIPVLKTTEEGFPFFTIEFDLICGNVSSTNLVCNVKGVEQIESEVEELSCYLDKDNAIFITGFENLDSVYFGASPDDILFWTWRKEDNFEVKGLSNLRDYTNFKLHYVGISREGDSMERLFLNAHTRRGEILSLVDTIRHGAHISDEIMIFFFDTSELGVNFYGVEPMDVEQMASRLENPSVPNKVRVIEDAEKAFVKFLNSEFNRVKFKGYPIKSKDGLSGENLTRHAFAICEDISFFTDDESFVGEIYSLQDRLPGDNADLIVVNNHKTAELIKK